MNSSGKTVDIEKRTGDIDGTRVAGRNVVGDVVSVLVPDAVVAGGTLDLPFVGKAGAFGIFPSLNAQDATFFGTKPVTVPVGTIPFTGSPFSISVVGTFNSQGVEVGVGLSGKIPTPAGDLVLFINVREGNLLTLLQDSKTNPDRPLTLSVNLGAALSVTDLVGRGVVVGTGGLALPIVEAFTAVGDLWAGAAYRASVTVQNGQIIGLKLSGVDIPLDQLGAVLGQKVTSDVTQKVAVPPDPVIDKPNKPPGVNRLYTVGNGIGIPGVGNLVYKGMQADGYYHVASRTGDYRVPPEVGYDKDAIRKWAIDAVAYGGIPRDSLYGGPTTGGLVNPAVAGIGSGTPSSPYRVGDYIGTPYGELVFKGLKHDGYRHVETRTGSYRVPTELSDDRDAIRGWVIKAIEYFGIPRDGLYQKKVSATVEDGGKVATAPETRQVVASGEVFHILMRDDTPVLTGAHGRELVSFALGTPVGEVVRLIQQANPFKGQGEPLALNLASASPALDPKLDSGNPKALQKNNLFKFM